jgi:hypothetical protein
MLQPHCPTITQGHLGKSRVLQILDRLNLHNLVADRWHFVAWTHDAEPFWGQPLVHQQDLLPSLLMPPPVVANEAGGLGPQNAWPAMRSRVGWIGFGAILAGLNPGDDYQQAVSTMSIGTVAPSQSAQAGLSNQVMHDRLVEIEQAARGKFGANSVLPYKDGSYSIRFEGRGRVIIKLVPQNPNGPDQHILLGLSDQLAPLSSYEPRPERLVRIGGQPFSVLRLELKPEGCALEIADAIFRQVVNRLVAKSD